MSSRRPRGGSSSKEDGKPPPEQRASLSAHKPTTATLTSPSGNNNDGGWGSPSRFGHFAKYTKPKIGPTYQCGEWYIFFIGGRYKRLFTSCELFESSHRPSYIMTFLPLFIHLTIHQL